MRQIIASVESCFAYSVGSRILLCLFLCAAPSVHCEEVSVDVSQTIRRLGSKSFVEREDASQELLFIGADAETALVHAMDSFDQEVRDRSRRLLKLIRQKKRRDMLIAFRGTPSENGLSQNQELDTRHQGETTAAPSKAIELPGWSRFSERHGDSADSRELYAKMMEAEWDLIESCFQAEDEYTRRNCLVTRYRDMLQRGMNYHTCSLGTATCFFYLYGEFSEAAGPGLQTPMFNYLRNPHINQALNGREKNSLIREIVSNWMIAATSLDMNDRNAQLALHNARFFNLEEASRFVAEQILKDKNALPMMKRNAMESIVARGDISQIGLIEPFLDDRTVLGVTGQRTRQLRDVALASAMQLQGYDVRKIGVRLLPSRASVFDYQSLGFITEGDREKAFETYRKLQAAKAEAQ